MLKMSNKQMLGSRVKELLAGVSDHGVDHLLEVETDLVQTTLLLAEAIEKLGQISRFACLVDDAGRAY